MDDLLLKTEPSLKERWNTLSEGEQKRILEELSFLQHLKNNGYHEPRSLGDGRWAALQELMFTVAILVGRMGDYSTYELRFCYTGASSDPLLNKMEAFEKARAALDAWNPITEIEPTGWMRDPNTGRRRPHGDASQEYVAI